LLELRKSGALEVIHCHIMSLESLDKLLRKKNIRPLTESVASEMGKEKAANETTSTETAPPAEETPPAKETPPAEE